MENSTRKELTSFEEKKVFIKKGKDEILSSVTGIPHQELAANIAQSAAHAITGRYNEPEELKLILQGLTDMGPTNTFEGMLCSQITTLHIKGMQYLARAEKADLRCHQDPDLNNAIKLLKLQHETMECLMRLRRGNEQKVTVQHQYVQVNGGQAVVGQMGGG
ncbi:MAG: hypothetical protein JSS09_06365, partial [Verrucomicrobia bacterium]|nr:hypothetical protein [Verrucomicrobiota bacterium]